MRDLKSGMGEFKVNGRTYKFDLLPPMEAIDFGSRVLKAAGGALVSICGEGEVHYDAIAKALSVVEASELSALMKEALKRSYTPEQEPLSNEAVFHSWFNQNPQDLFVALWAEYSRTKLHPATVGISVPVPDSHQDVILVNRILRHGLCTYKELIDGTLSLKDVVFLMKCADWEDYATSYVRVMQEG